MIFATCTLMENDKIHNGEINTVSDLLFRSRPAVRLVNSFSLYRILSAPLLLTLLFLKKTRIFNWLLMLSFSTDAVDGYLARKLKASTPLGSKLDSLGDDLTILVAAIALCKTNPKFIREQSLLVSLMLGLFTIQTTAAIRKYGKATSFHTYLAKMAAMAQGVFLLHSQFFKKSSLPLFRTAAGITIVELIEETIMTLVLPKWKTDVKGLYWAVTKKTGPELS